MTFPVLILGADGFIGRHIAFALRARGHDVLCSARRVTALKAMGFRTLRADLGDSRTHDATFWRPHLAGGRRLINAAGLLGGSEAAFEAVHLKAPTAAIAALEPGAGGVLISAIGIDGADTAFARWRRRAETLAHGAGLTILRPGLVLADTSYGGSSLLRTLAALPFATPVVGSGDQRFNPIHAEDLAEIVAECLEAPPGAGPLNGAWPVGGPEDLSQSELVRRYRGWLGLRPARLFRLPLRIARAVGSLGDLLRLGPVSRSAVEQLQSGVWADPAALAPHLQTQPRAAGEFITRRPAGTQDLWQARLYLLKPAIRLTLALMWLCSGLLGLLLPAEAFPSALQSLPAPLVLVLAWAGGIADLALALALLRNWRPRLVALAQLAMVAAYTVGLSLVAPGLWLAPFGELLKNLPILALIGVHLVLTEER